MLAISKLALLACLALALVGLASAYKVERCDNNHAIQQYYLRVSSCPDDHGTDYCHMRLNDRISYDVKFNTSQSYHGRTYYTTLDIRDHHDRWFRAFTHQACDNHGLRCPIEARRESYFKDSFDLSHNMVSSSYRIGLMDPKRGMILCLQFPARVDGTKDTWDLHREDARDNARDIFGDNTRDN